MDDFWTTRSGRWRIRLARDLDGPLESRLYQLICADISAGLLPAGAVLPSVRKVALELGIEESIVTRAYETLRADGFLEERPGQGLYIAPDPARALDAKAPGVDTMVRFEARLLDLARRAAAEGHSARDASGVFPKPPETDET